MLGIDILDVALGLAFVYLLLSLMVTAVNEMFAAWFKRRAWMLQKGLANMIDDPQTVADLLQHPLVRSLYEPRGRLSQMPGLRSLFGNGPSYIPAHAFATAFLDVVERSQDKQEGDGAEREPKTGQAGKVIAALSKQSSSDRDQLKRDIEVWFSDSMERVSGWYKRHTQAISLLCAVIVTVLLNADTLVIARALWSDPALREATVTRATHWVREHADTTTQSSPGDRSADGAVPPPPLPPYEQADVDFREASFELRAAMADLAELRLPIGWHEETGTTSEAISEESRLVRTQVDTWPGTNPFRWDVWTLWWLTLSQHAFGWFITILAVSLGAPFWFDVLNKVVSIRGVGKAPEEKQKSPKTVPEPKEPGKGNSQSNPG